MHGDPVLRYLQAKQVLASSRHLAGCHGRGGAKIQIDQQPGCRSRVCFPNGGGLGFGGGDERIPPFNSFLSLGNTNVVVYGVHAALLFFSSFLFVLFLFLFFVFSGGDFDLKSRSKEPKGPQPYFCHAPEEL